ncbi:hypothetical protein TRFO_17377 [Tritrichomonas foetus]|uniref:AAA+ ATPase domain-containing protein n=1 Tax=Tritrichomonas foetus TaxID=1144522 RepID=A0A1J4KP98_9EUKA|nr:hypothetical protein TRFO_17377 [Tritrichomonas foetus]|eukprot:OHT12744.1 hypothetical protein TRFO_17377 [Tritrichomonas foetus]
MNLPSFIETKGSLERVNKVLDGIQSGIPVLLEGETGTSKTKTATIASIKNNQKPIILNFSSQTTIEDLLGRITRNENSWSGFSFKNGPYTDAYVNGHCLILDEINLAHETVLQCIEASLDSGSLSFEVSGSETKVLRMHKDFHIIATQNPLTGRFSQKRQYLSHKFRSRFQTILFPDIEKEELFEIAMGLAQGLKNHDPDLISKIIDFHFLWKEKESKTNQIHVFTIREINGTIKSMMEGLSPFESILIHYGSRYDKDKLEEMKKDLISLNIQKVDSSSEEEEFQSKLFLPDYDHSLFYSTKSIQRALLNSYHLLNTYHPVLFVGDDGCGKTSIARWLAQIYSNKHKLFICNPEMSISDIIGRYMPVKGATGESPILWINGPVVQSLENGDCLIMDQIDTAPSTILERLNALYDGIGSEDFKFLVQENSEDAEILVHSDFRIIATASYKGLNDLSPAFLNRFTIIYIDDQFPELSSSKDEMKGFINHFSPSFCNNDDIQLLLKKIYQQKMNMPVNRISTIVRGFFELKNKFPSALSQNIADFCFDVTTGSVYSPNLNENFIDILLNSLDVNKQNDLTHDFYHFKEASTTRRIIATLIACSVIGKHVVMVGKTGLGKTAAAIAFSKMNQFSEGFKMISFNGEIQLEELFGFFTIEKGDFTQHDGPLSTSMLNGHIFIADELNLAEQQIVQSLNVALEPTRDDTIILPVIGSSIQVNKGFLFIGCQNDLTMHGRRPLPESFKKKVLLLEYPENSHQDLLLLTNSLAKQFALPVNVYQGITNMIEKMKDFPSFKTKQWSLREVRKLFRRVSYFSNQTRYVKNLTIHHLAAFLLISPFPNKYEVAKDAISLITESFHLSNYKELLKWINSPVDVKFTNNTVILTKGNIEITLINSEIQKIPAQLQTFWQSLFETCITHPSEPLLFVGPSGFKTFLSHSISPLSPIVHLHSDSTIPSLIGQISLLDKYQATMFLFDALHDFTGINQTIEDLFINAREKIENNDLDNQTIDELIKKLKEIAPQAYSPIIEHISQQIKDMNNNFQNTSSMFSNYRSLFKPGLITKAILQQKSLILKNIAQPSPSVLERFNELLSVTPTLTLFEDTSNTLTTETTKILSNFSQHFRIIGICLPDEKRGLSEAMLSRLTEIYLPCYPADEQKYVFQSIFKSNFSYDHRSSTFYEMLIDTLNKINNDKNFPFSIPFTRVVEIIKIACQWSMKYENIQDDIIFSLALFRCAGGPLQLSFRKKLAELLSNTLPIYLVQIFLYNNNTDKEEIEDIFDQQSTSLISSEELANGNFLINNSMTNFQIESLFPPIQTRLCLFTPTFNDLVDLIFSAATINYPLIIEGPCGCGKSTAFFYVAEMLNANIVHISISSSTTVEDLFGKYEPNTDSDEMQFDFIPTNFLNAIRADKTDEITGRNNWILIEELHLASASVLDALGPVFNPDNNKILLPNGTIVSKGEYFVVGIMSEPIQRQSITNTALYYKAHDYSEKEFTAVCRYILSCTDLKEYPDFKAICDSFCNVITGLKEISTSSQYKVPVTIRETVKFIKLISSLTSFDEIDDVLKMLCIGRFADSNFAKAARSDLGFSDNENSFDVMTENAGTILRTEFTTLDIETKLSTRHSELYHLTLSEQKLFSFLSCAIKFYSPIIIQGSTASGKTYSVQLFADILGQPLRVIQLNSEINSSTIAGVFQPSKNLNDIEVEELQQSLDLIKNFPNLPENFAEKIRHNNINEWNPQEFKSLRKYIEDKYLTLDETSQENARLFIKKIDKSLQFYNHLIRADSLLIKSLIDGTWLLLDGIESAPPDFFDRIYTLLDDEPTLNLYERGSGYEFSFDAKDASFRIHPNFRLFMTFNPVDSVLNSISSSFLSRCMIFSMNPIDNNTYNTSKAISGLINNSYFQFTDNISEVAIRLARIHSIAKELAQNQQIIITARSFIHMCRTISYKKTISYELLLSIIKTNYSLTMNENVTFLTEIENVFNDQVDIEILKILQRAQRNTSRSCITIIKMIDNYINQLNEYNNGQEFIQFNFIEFLNTLFEVQLKDIDQICDKMHSLMRFFSTQYQKFNSDQLSHFSAIKCLDILLNDIKNEYIKEIQNPMVSNSTLNSDSIKSELSFQVIIYKMQILSALIQKELFVFKSPPLFLFDDLKSILFSMIEKMNENDFHDLLRYYVTLYNLPYSSSIIDLQENPHAFLLSLKHFYQSNNWISCLDTNLLKICSCIFLNTLDTHIIFTGMLKSFFIASQYLLNKSDFKVFMEWINYLDQFFKVFPIKSYASAEFFFESANTWLNCETQQEFSEHLSEVRLIQISYPRSINEFIDDYEMRDIKQIHNFINNFYLELTQKFNENFLKQVRDQEAGKKFIQLKDTISKRLENSSELIEPLTYFYQLMDGISSVTSESYIFLENVYKSIKLDHSPKNNDIFIWPCDLTVKNTADEMNSPILDAMINYSLEMNRINELSNPTWMKICNFDNPMFLLKDFIDNGHIQQSTIKYYTTMTNANYLYKLYQINPELCNRNNIIKYLNSYFDRFAEYSENTIKTANHLTKKYGVNFTIHIPDFSIDDLISLIINPFDQTNGILLPDSTNQDFLIYIFSNVCRIPSIEAALQFLIDSLKLFLEQNLEENSHLSSLFNAINSIDQIHEVVMGTNSISNEIQSITKGFYIAYDIARHVFSSNNKETPTFADIIYYNDINEYVDMYPSCGYYVLSHPEVDQQLKNIKNNISNTEFPLALLIFRSFTHSRIIQMQVPTTIPTNVELLTSNIAKIILNGIKEKKISKFSNLIGFLLDQPPSSFNTYKSEHFRNILLNMVVSVKSDTLSKLLLNYFNEKIADYLYELGSANWQKLLNDDISSFMKSKNQLFNFIVNPWFSTLNQIKTEFEAMKKTINNSIRIPLEKIFDEFTRFIQNKFFNDLTEAMQTDSSNLQNKLEEEYKRFQQQHAKRNKDDQMEEMLKKKWTFYCKVVNRGLSLIETWDTFCCKRLPTFPSNDMFVEFLNHFSNDPVFLPSDSKNTLIMVIKPKNIKESDIVNIKYTNNHHSEANIQGKISTKIGFTLLKLPNDKSINDYNFNSSDADISFITVRSDISLGQASKFSVKDLNTNYQTFFQTLNKISEEDELNNEKSIYQKIGRVQILFRDSDFANFQTQLKDSYKTVSSKFIKARSITEIINCSHDLKESIAEIRKYFPAKYLIDLDEPTNTNLVMKPLIEFVTKSEEILKKISINDDFYADDEEITINKNSEFNKLLIQSTHLTKHLVPVGSSNEEQFYKKENFAHIDTKSKKLLTPSIFKDDDNISLNIEKIEIDVGPFLAGIDISPMIIRILNFSNQQLFLKFDQADSTLPVPTYESNNGFLLIKIPIENIEMSLTQNTDLDFEGNVLIYESLQEDSSPFSVIPYSIKLHYTPPSLFLSLDHHYLAIKGGSAQLVPFLCTVGSVIEFKKYQQFMCLNQPLIELPENSAKKPSCLNNADQLKISINSEFDLDENFLALNADFGFNQDIPVPIPIKLKLTNIKMNVSIYCEKRNEFVTDNPLISIGNLWRKVYVHVEYYNAENYAVYPQPFGLDAKLIEIKNEKMNQYKIPAMSFQSKIYTFQVRTIDRLNRSDQNLGQLTLKVGKQKLSKTIQFKYVFIGINDKLNNIIYPDYIPHSFWNGKDFQLFDRPKHLKQFLDYEDRIMVSPFSFTYKNKSSTNQTVKYDIFSGNIVSNYQNRFETYEVLSININGEVNIENTKPQQSKASDKLIKLFARVPGKPDTYFPCFSPYQNEIQYNFANSNTNTYKDDFIDWFNSFLYEGDKLQSFEGLKNNYFIVTNFGSVILFLSKIIDKIPYASLKQYIHAFTGTEIYGNEYDKTYKSINILEWKFVNTIWALHRSMNIRYFQLKNQNFALNLPIPFEAIVKEQEELLSKVKLTQNQVENSQRFTRSIGKENEYNNKEKIECDKFKEQGYDISKVTKWTLVNGFTASNQTEADEYTKAMQNTIYNVNESTNTIGNINDININVYSLNNTRSIIAIYQMFDAILQSTYQFTFILYSYLKNKKDLEPLVKLFNQITTFYEWAEKTYDVSPYKEFLNLFLPSYKSMINRLISSHLNIYPTHKPKDTLLISNYNESDFLNIPKSKINTNLIFKNNWQQLGKKNNGSQQTIKNKQIKFPKRQFTPSNKKEDRSYYMYDSTQERKPVKKILKKNSENISKIGNAMINATKQKQIVVGQLTTEDQSSEVTNQDYMQDIIHKMINPDLKETLSLFSTDKTHIPINYHYLTSIENTSDRTNDSINNDLKRKEMLAKKLRVKPFFKAATILCNSILSCFENNDNLLNNCDDCYSTILIDCSSTFSDLHKASLITLAISYANALTALRIPYSIVVFCDQNFQYVVKKLEENHEQIHFERLLEAMTVKRRMSSMSDAIQIVKAKIKPTTDEFIYRKNHSIYVLTDGISTKLNIGSQWVSKILNDSRVSISFFFLDIIAEEHKDLIHKIWDNFSADISSSKSPSSVFYSNVNDIFKGNTIFCNAFEFPISHFNQLNSGKIDKNIKLLKPANQISLIVNENLQKIIKLLNKRPFDEDKFYVQFTNTIEYSEPLEIEIPLYQTETFCVNVSEVQDYYPNFLDDLIGLTEMFIDISLIQEMSSLVFPPNKPSQYSPSSNGTLFYFPGLVRFLLTQGQDTKIFLEKKAGLLRSYSVFVVIDCSISCFNLQTFSHSYQTIITLLRSLSKIDLPSFNLIVTTKDGPVILCSENSTTSALDPCSPLWISLMTYLSNPHSNSQLLSALLSVTSIRSQQKTSSSILFVLTDGNYGNEYCHAYSTIFDNISLHKTTTVTIGIGSYSSNIKSISQKAVWSLNPKNLLRSIITLFGKETTDLTSIIQTMYLNAQIDQTFINEKLLKNLTFNSYEEYLFDLMFKELNRVTRQIAVFKDFYTAQEDGKESIKGNLEGDQYDMGKNNFYHGVKILICLFWDSSLALNEAENISEKVLIDGMDGKTSVIRALKLFGMEPMIVKSYDKAIYEMCKGEYSQVWVICGRYDGRLPDEKNSRENGKANLAFQFIEALILYWQNGGGIVFWTDNFPLCAEVNFFLEKAKFEGNTVNFTIKGHSPGGSMLVASKTSKKSSFTSAQTIICDGYEKYLYNFHLNSIFEGITIASAFNKDGKFANANEILPFKAFSTSSDGGISSLYYNSPLESLNGDIVIDCGFSKLFFELNEEGIYRYVRNIAIFMLSLEKKASMFGGTQDPRQCKPKPFKYQIKPFMPPNPPFFIYNIKREVDVIFMIDGTGSMRFFIDAVRESCTSIAKSCRERNPDNMFRFGCVIYRDDAVNQVRYGTKNYKIDHAYFALTQNEKKLQDFLSKVETFGGGNDGPEDWLSGYNLLLKMNWSEAGEKIVIHIADAPGHGIQFNQGHFQYPYFTGDEKRDHFEYDKMDNEHDRKFPLAIKNAADLGIRFYCLNASRSSWNSFKKTQEIYQKAKGKSFIIREFYDAVNGAEISSQQKQKLLQVVQDVAIQSVDNAVAVDKNHINESHNQTKSPSKQNQTSKANFSKNQSSNPKQSKKQKQQQQNHQQPQQNQQSNKKKPRAKKKTPIPVDKIVFKDL